MVRPYSADLRSRVLARMDAGESIRSLAKQFDISPSCIPKWKKRRTETGSHVPGKTGGGKKHTLSGTTGEWLRERVHSGPFTLRKLVAELAERGIKTDSRAVWTFVRAEGLRYKKNALRDGTEAPGRNAQTQAVETVSEWS